MKVPVVVGNCTGFAVNQTFFPYGQGRSHLSITGKPKKKIVAIYWLQDLTEYGVAMAVLKEYEKAFPDRVFKSPLIELLVKNGRNGKNNGKGHYIYEKGSKPKPDLSVLPIIEESRRLTNIMPGGKPISVTDKVLEMVLFPVVYSGFRHAGFLMKGLLFKHLTLILHLFLE
ncbi:hypothetical protein F3Y22_tig00111002pilonHSYRG00008 [Hibiscus syriacus]|uniref:3-hydroxyacyl-CoA dehydrogenase C-terminal domain-containing protein n=1 Tax=Hibiscus syriacus TaxID=106335 RepID=A0A6A2ZAK6_HIBSY|nr:hypothetical protein F3Y22_tig00111002pilonHSYRG00008 [Hibiscus syriacus]